VTQWIAGSDPAGKMVVCLLRVLYVVRQRPLRRADHSSRGIIQRARVCVCVCVVCMVCVCVCVCMCVCGGLETSAMGWPRPTMAVEPWEKIIRTYLDLLKFIIWFTTNVTNICFVYTT
jgi:hypothetical protein